MHSTQNNDVTDLDTAGSQSYVNVRQSAELPMPIVIAPTRCRFVAVIAGSSRPTPARVRLMGDLEAGLLAVVQAARLC